MRAGASAGGAWLLGLIGMALAVGVALGASQGSVASWSSDAHRVGVTSARHVIDLGDGVRVPLRSSERTAAQERLFRRAVTEAAAGGATLRQLRSTYGLIWDSKAPMSSWRARGPVVDRLATPRTVAARTACGMDGISGGESPDDMTMLKPGFFIDLDHRTHYAIARFRYDDGPTAPGYCSPPVGGRDGIGLTLSQDVVRVGQDMVYCAQMWTKKYCDRSSKYHGTLEDNSQRGASFTFQDHVFLSTMQDNYLGTITVAFRYLHPRRCHQAFAKYAHTWDTTAVNGFGVGPYSFSIQWTRNENKWAKASDAAQDRNCP